MNTKQRQKRFPHLRYLNELVELKCNPELLAHNMFPNAKEVTESFGAYNAVREHLKHRSFKDPNVTVVVVGDGCTPRTGATFAYRTAWNVISIDPMLRSKPFEMWIKRLTCYRRKVEEVNIVCETPVIVVAVHSHADLQLALKSIKAPEIDVIAMPCCVVQNLDRQPDIEYQDNSVLSPSNTIKIWKGV